VHALGLSSVRCKLRARNVADRLQDSEKRSQTRHYLQLGRCKQQLCSLLPAACIGEGSLPSSASRPGTPGDLLVHSARLRPGAYQDLGGTRRIVVAAHNLALQFGHELAFQGVHLVGV
jgi:hypothetical protein